MARDLVIRRLVCPARVRSSSLLLDAGVGTARVVFVGTIINAAVLWCVGGSLDDEDSIKLVMDVPLLSSDEAGGVKDEGTAIKPLT